MEDAWNRIYGELMRREKWVSTFQSDLHKVEVERRERVEAELSQLMSVLVETAHL